jgi:hypothetical protein
MGRAAHSIWELRPAEDDLGGCVLVRKREERAVDLRQAGAAAPGTQAAVAAGIIRTARLSSPSPTPSASVLPSPRRAGSNPPAAVVARRPAPRPRRAAQTFLVSLLQVPGGDVAARKTVIAEETMEIEDIERLVKELKLGPTTHAHDTWSDGEWELRVRGPKGQLIHGYDSTGPDEIGGAKGQALLDTLTGVIESGAAEGGDELGGGDGELPPPGEEGILGAPLPPEEGVEPPPTEPGMEPPPPEGEMPPPPADAAGAGEMPPPPPGPVAPTAAALKKGQRVRIVRNGQIADALVMLVHPSEQALSVLLNQSQGGGAMMPGAGGGAGMVETVSMGDVVDDGSGMGGDELGGMGMEEDPNQVGAFDLDVAPDGGEFIEVLGDPGMDEGGAGDDFGGGGDGGDDFGGGGDPFADAVPEGEDDGGGDDVGEIVDDDGAEDFGDFGGGDDFGGDDDDGDFGFSARRVAYVVGQVYTDGRTTFTLENVDYEKGIVWTTGQDGQRQPIALGTWENYLKRGWIRPHEQKPTLPAPSAPAHVLEQQGPMTPSQPSGPDF